MVPSIVIVAITCIAIILSILFFPHVKLGKFTFDAYWMIALVGAIAMLLSGQVHLSELWSALTADTAINPFKILVLFLSMTLLSVFLDEVGVFSYLACVTLKKANSSQLKLFLYLYIIVSVLTVFTSNDIVVLSFTPFICYFAKNAKISPMPYLFAEFVAANTWSMALIIGNPTNIYLATSFGIDFVSYFLVMIVPTFVAGLTALGILYLMFRKQLKEKITPVQAEVKIEHRVYVIIGVAHLAICTVLLAVGSYIGLPMWIVAFASMFSLRTCIEIIAIIKKRRPNEMISSFRREPWALIPFMLSMFTLILGLSSRGFTELVAKALGEDFGVLKYGISSFLAANLINNIPMSVLFASILEGGALPSVYATIIGSNLGAFFTPIGALAGIMWSSILRKHELKFSFLDFIKRGILVSVPTLLTSLFALWLVSLLLL